MKPYFVSTRQRSGSYLLYQALNSHSKIINHGEILLEQNNYDNSFSQFKAKEIINNKSLALERDAYLIINKFLEYKYLSNTELCTGFDLKYNQDNIIPGFLKCLSDKPFKVIHLIRGNILKNIISCNLNLRNKELNRKSHGFSKVKPVKYEIDINNILTDLHRIKIEILEHQFLFNDVFKNRNLTVFYEDMTCDHDEVLGTLSKNISMKLLNFLEVSYNKELIINTRKTNPPKLKDFVINYSELHEQLQNSEWEFLLSEKSTEITERWKSILNKESNFDTHNYFINISANDVQLFNKAIRRMLLSGFKNIAVFGTGDHTVKLFPALKHTGLNVAFLIDNYKKGKMYGLDIYSFENSPLHEIDCILISSKVFEIEIKNQITRDNPLKLPVVTIYDY
jgi:hypothetical protein